MARSQQTDADEDDSSDADSVDSDETVLLAGPKAPAEEEAEQEEKPFEPWRPEFLAGEGGC